MWIRFNEAGNFWEVSLDSGAVFEQLLENALHGIVDFLEQTAPAVSAAGAARIYFDETDGVLKISKNGAAYEVLGGAAPMVLEQEDPDEIPLTIITPVTSGVGLPPNLLGATLVAWYDFSDITTLFTDTARTTPVTTTGQIVKGVTDKAAGSYHLSEATNGPTYRTAPSPSINGKACLQFDGTNDQLISTNTVALYGRSTTTTVMGVMLHDTAFGAEGGGWSPSRCVIGNAGYTLGGSNFGGTQKYVVHHSTSGSAILARITGNEDVWHIITAIMTGNGAADPSWVGNTYVGADDTRAASLVNATATGNLGLASATTIRVGSAGSTLFYPGYIAEVAIFSPQLTETQRKQLETHWATKYGRTLPYSIAQYGNVDLFRIENQVAGEIVKVTKDGDLYVKGVKINP